MPELRLHSPHGTATLHTLGATVLSWIPTGQTDVLWVSPTAHFRVGKAIRGGIPVCWPWFASDPAHPGGPSHGLVRAAEWDVQSATDTEAILTIHHKGPQFPEFRLTLTVRLGRTLSLLLTHQNLSEQQVDCTGALHSYFRAKSATARVVGLGAAPAFDKLTGQSVVLDGPVRFGAKIDRVIASDALAVLDDGGRQVEIHRTDAPDVVCWNPNTDRPGDVPVGGEADFVCVEAAAVSQPWTVPAMSQRTLECELRVRE